MLASGTTGGKEIMARERSLRGRRRKPLTVREKALAISACAANLFDSSIPVPEGVLCGIIAVEHVEGSDEVRLTACATFIEP